MSGMNQFRRRCEGGKYFAAKKNDAKERGELRPSRRGAAQFAKIAAGEKRRNWTLIVPLSLSHKLSGSRKSEVDAAKGNDDGTAIL